MPAGSHILGWASASGETTGVSLDQLVKSLSLWIEQDFVHSELHKIHYDQFVHTEGFRTNRALNEYDV